MPFEYFRCSLYAHAYSDTFTGKTYSSDETHRRPEEQIYTTSREMNEDEPSCEARVHRRAITSCPFSLERLTHLSARCIDNPLTRFGRWLHLLPLTAWHVTSWSPESHFSSVVPRSPPYRLVSSLSLASHSRPPLLFQLVHVTTGLFSYGSQSFGKFPETSPETRSLAPFLFSLLLLLPFVEILIPWNFARRENCCQLLDTRPCLLQRI